jgi:hypothetical protein
MLHAATVVIRTMGSTPHPACVAYHCFHFILIGCSVSIKTCVQSCFVFTGMGSAQYPSRLACWWLCLHGMSSAQNLLPLFPSRKSCWACGSGDRDRSPSPSSIYLNVLIRCRLCTHFHCGSPCFGNWERSL